jgi:ADP-ribosylglycohydrolase
MAGALYGASGIPQHWRERLAWHDDIAELARRLLAGQAELTRPPG